ncbi:replication-relaxation family protein [Paenibacillus sp. PL91]|uniref:replication-relaxation family protein n=1 Tax=Paenibacillus sp. PL91 TaxID=2729538 RepID=UPI00145D0A03|nr:replication-relaxation family protein [Paenibacillus sp. PL91]MBC9199783.1 replication-relaxation family protein [Paenibacillus sp. PL91]
MSLTINRTQAKLARWIAILHSCDRFGYLTTSQIQRLHNLGGSRNTTRILGDMSEFLSSFREGETVWYLNARGRKEIGSQTQRRRTLHVNHAIIRNEVYVAYRPEQWREEHTVKWDDKTLIADALFRAKAGGPFTFLEVDNTQAMAQNERKIGLYRELCATGRWQAKNGPFPTIMYVTVSEYRHKRLTALLHGMDAKVLTIADL